MGQKKSRFSTLYPLSERDKYMILGEHYKERNKLSAAPQYVSEDYVPISDNQKKITFFKKHLGMKSLKKN